MTEKGLRIALIFMVAMTLSLASYALPASVEGSPQEMYVGTFFRKAERFDDPFYGERVLAYKVGDVARIDVLAYNPRYTLEFNVIKVGIRFDWMPRDEFIYSEECGREDPYVLKPLEWALFPLYVEVPDKPGINEFPHLYDVSVVALEDMEEKTVGRDMGYGIAVYSQEQAEAVALYERLSQRLGLSSLSLMALPRPPAPTFTTSEANTLGQRAGMRAVEGLEKYKKGEFSAAKDDFLAALELFDRALEAETERGKAAEEAEMGQARALRSQAEAFDAQARAFANQADAQAEQARALRSQAEAFDAQARAFANQADAQARQVDALDDQARAAEELAQATREQAGSSAVLAWGLTAGTILIGIGAIIHGISGLDLRKKRPATSK